MKHLLITVLLTLSSTVFAQVGADRLAVTHNHGSTLIDDPDAESNIAYEECLEDKECLDLLAVTHNYGPGLIDDPDAEQCSQAKGMAAYKKCLKEKGDLDALAVSHNHGQSLVDDPDALLGNDERSNEKSDLGRSISSQSTSGSARSN